MSCSTKPRNFWISDSPQARSPDNCHSTGSEFILHQEVNSSGHLPRLQFPLWSPAKDISTDADPKGYDGSCEGAHITPSLDHQRTSSDNRIRSSTTQVGGTHALPDGDVVSTRSSRDWSVPNQRAPPVDTSDNEQSLFLNPFRDASDHQSRKSSTASGYSAYIRPNAFSGHRDTFARISHAQVFPKCDENSGSGSVSNNAAQTRRHSAYATLPHAVLQLTLGYFSFSEYKLLRLVCRQWCQDLPPPHLPAFYRLPRELVQQILGYLLPCGFDSARHICASWYFASQDRKLQEQMLRLGCCKSAFEEDLRLQASPEGFVPPRLNLPDDQNHGQPVDFSRLYQEWICGRRLATESRLSPDWHGRTTAGTSSANRVSLIEEIGFSKILESGNGDATQSHFTVSACRKFVLVTSAGYISLFGLSNRGHTIKPIVKLAAGVQVLKVSMDTSSGRYAVAALLSGRKGMLWELVDNMTQTRYRKSSGEPISLGMQADVQSSASSPVSRDIALNLSMPTADFHSTSALQLAFGDTALSSDSPSQPTVPIPPSYYNESLRQAGAADCVSAAEFQGGSRRYSIPIETNATALYTNLGSPDDEPRSVSICPNRKCLAFGCRMGVELHWVDALTGGDLSRWFPLAAPSDFLFFLPARENIDPRRKLRLISSAIGPGAAALTRSDSTSGKWKYWQTSSLQGRRQSMTRLSFGNLPVPTAAISTGQRSSSLMPIRRQSGEVQGVLRTVDCDHYRAVPLSDGKHLLFTDPLNGLLCLGVDAPLGGPTKLVRKVLFAPPHAMDEGCERALPRRYTAGQDLRWGVRIVAAQQDGTIMLYNVPRDLLEHLQDPRKSFDLCAESQGVIGQSDLPIDTLMERQDPSPTPSSKSQTSPTRPVQIPGARLMRVEDDIIDDIAIDTSFGGFLLWIFCRRGVARLYNIYAPRHHQVKFRYVGENGLLYESTGVTTEEEVAEEQYLKGEEKAEDRGRLQSLHVTWA
ncbi:uncharacterized protein A1O9_11989 [Exophiala aquamarina CBS 119918]|uniref:F-box domain-containing protein n=1 Tax=Exophiala aquamarina CBS 119918 TaxID=1182545 RepID=A0A072NVV3_9EURO|nr:uncharacterized protein A1O9_11989 [Exophiala aquamarina CBS 119918]KEF51999.1 hypothetical protein A1O9_11989 [Exophiala aquamarina CBS 119918]